MEKESMSMELAKGLWREKEKHWEEISNLENKDKDLFINSLFTHVGLRDMGFVKMEEGARALVRYHEQIIDGEILLPGETEEETRDFITKRLERGLCKIYLISKTDMPILIIGETGTGKTLMAKAAHFMSDRRDKKFVPINCTATPEHLLESELFGHEKGAFTGAVTKKKGLLETEGGTVFLDEIGKMPEASQVKLLKVIEEKQFQPLGSNKWVEIDSRFIAAIQPRDMTNFHPDLFWRFQKGIEMPTLRERLQFGIDNSLITGWALEKVQAETDSKVKGIEDPGAAFQLFRNYDFPGNYRELESILRNALINAGAARRKEISKWDLQDAMDENRRLLEWQWGATGSDKDSSSDLEKQLGGKKLSEILDYAKGKAIEMVEARVKYALKQNHFLKSALEKEGISGKEYQNVRKKILTFIGKAKIEDIEF